MDENNNLYLELGQIGRISGVTYMVTSIVWAVVVLKITTPMLVFACLGTAFLGISFPILHVGADQATRSNIKYFKWKIMFPVRDYISYLGGATFLFVSVFCYPVIWLMIPAYVVVLVLGTNLLVHFRAVPWA